MQGRDPAPAYPSIAGGMGLCESTLPQLGRALRPQEKGNNHGVVGLHEATEGGGGQVSHHLIVHTNPCTTGTHLHMLPPHHWLMPLEYNLSRGASVRDGKYNSRGRDQKKGACGTHRSWDPQRVKGGTDIEPEKDEIW